MDDGCDTPECITQAVTGEAQRQLCAARTRHYIERGDGRLPATVAFPVLIHKGFAAEPVWVETFHDLGYHVVTDTRSASFVVSKQTHVGALGMGSKHPIGGGGICEDTQRFNQIPGSQHMTDKASFNRNVRLWKEPEPWGTSTAPGAPSGFRADQLVPLTFNMPDKADCEAFIKVVKSREGRHKRWMLKRLQLQNNMGVKLLDENDIKVMLAHQARNKECLWSGIGADGAVVQEYIERPLLIYGHKIDFRVFLFVASTNPLLAFYYPIFMVRRSSKSYLPAHGHEAILTAVAGHEKLKDEKVRLNSYQYTPDELQEYLHEHAEAPIDLLDRYIHPSFQHTLSTALAANVKALSRSRGYFGLYGADVMMTRDFQARVLEINFSPQFSNQGASEWKRHLNRAIVEEAIHIEHAILAIRAERGIDAHISIQDLGDAVLNMRPIAEEQPDGSVWWYHEHENHPGTPSRYERADLLRRQRGLQCDQHHQQHWEDKVNKIPTDLPPSAAGNNTAAAA